MIQDIYPSRLDNSFSVCRPSADDLLLFFDKDGRVLSKTEGGEVGFLTYKDRPDEKAIYLFAVDDTKYFLSREEFGDAPQGFEYYTVRELRDCCSGKTLFAAFTAYHLWRWYADNKFCGRCGSELVCSEKERALVCPDCGNTVYPRINPAVIVGVINGDSILITRYKRGYAHNALVAGFTEIGETIEQTVEREVMEETGVRVRNIRYYKSQPWGMAQDMLIGFFCDAETSDIRMDEGELKYAEWVKREDIVLQPNNNSLTNEMMSVFKYGLKGV